MKISDQYICELLSADNKQGMNLLFKKYFESLVIWADTFLNDMDLSKDLVQDFFVMIWRKKTYRNWNAEKLSSYLHVSVKNQAYNRIKKKDILKYTEPIESVEQIYEEYQARREEIAQKILEEIEKLPEKGGEVVKCVYLRGMKYQEAAEELNVSISTIKTQLVRSLKALKINSGDLSDFLFIYFFTKK